MSIYDDILRDRSKLRRSTEAGGAWEMSIYDDILQAAETYDEPFTEAQLDQAHELQELLWEKVHDLVDAELAGVDATVAAGVRHHMTETFRFW